jgi:hypothetical protein
MFEERATVFYAPLLKGGKGGLLKNNSLPIDRRVRVWVTRK